MKAKKSPKKNQQQVEATQKVIEITRIGVPKMLYRSPVFLPEKYLIREIRTVNNKWANGFIDGALGQNHMDVLEGMFVCQSIIIGNESAEKITGIVVDPYRLKKTLKKVSYTYLKKYLNDMKECDLDITFNFGNEKTILAKGPIIKSIDTYKEVYCPKIKANRKILKIEFPDWFIEMCLIPPFSNNLNVFYDEKDHLRKAIRRFLSSHDQTIRLPSGFVLSSLQMPKTNDNIALVDLIMDNTK